MSIVKILRTDERYERRKFLEFIKQDLEFQSFQYQKKIHDCTIALESVKNQILKLTRNINILKDYGVESVPFVEPIHSDPSVKPEIIVKTIGLSRIEKLRVPCGICGEVQDNRIKLKEHKYERHSYTDG